MLPTLDGLPFHIAKAQGIYDSLGLDLTILSFNSAYDRDAAFQFKSMDGMITDYPSAVTLQAILPPRPCRIHRNECPSPVSDQHTGIGN